MATSLLSLALDRSLDPTIAMTGELTVTGKVLRIGGLREKTVAARRAGSKMIIFPDDNLSDWLELPEVRHTARIFPLFSSNSLSVMIYILTIIFQNIKEGIEGRPAKWYSDVFGLVFPDLDKDQANSLWKDQLQKKKKGSEKDDEDDD